MQFTGRQTQFYIDIVYGIAFSLGFGYLLFVSMDPRIAAFQAGLVLGYFLRVWENMSIYERILEEEVAAEAEDAVAEELETQVPDRAEEQVDEEIEAQLEDRFASEVEEQVSEEVTSEVEERVEETIDERIRAEVGGRREGDSPQSGTEGRDEKQ